MDKPESEPFFELSITLNGEEQSYKKKFICYESAKISQEDPLIREFIEDAKKECKFEIEDIRIKASF